MLILALSFTLAPPSTPRDDVDFLRDVYPIFQAHCIKCHGPAKQKGKLRLDQRDGIFGAGSREGVVAAGDADASLLVDLVSLPADDLDIMPAEGDPLTADQIALLRRWITEGAPFSEPPKEEVEPDPLALPPITPEQAAERDRAVAALAARGVAPRRVAQGGGG